MCKHCRGKAKSKVASAAVAASVRATNLPTGSTEKIYVVYEGPQAGGFSINSKVARKRKYRVTQFRPFEVLLGDEWIANVKDFEIVKLAPPPKVEDLTPAGIPSVPHVEIETPPIPGVSRPKFNIPPGVVENNARTSISQVRHELGNALVDKLLDAGLTTLESVRHDILTNRGRAILDIRGVGKGKLEEIRRVILG